MAVDDRHHERAGVIARGDRVDVGTGLDQRVGRLGIALTHRIQQRREAALPADQLIELVVAIDPGHLRTAASGPPSKAGSSTLRSLSTLRTRRTLCTWCTLRTRYSRVAAKARALARQVGQIGDLAGRLEVGAFRRQ